MVDIGVTTVVSVTVSANIVTQDPQFVKPPVGWKGIQGALPAQLSKSSIWCILFAFVTFARVAPISQMGSEDGANV